MSDWIKLVGPNHAVELFGVKLVGVNAENGKKLLFTIVFVAVVLVIGRVARIINASIFDISRRHRAHFWARQIIHVCVTILLLLATVAVIGGRWLGIWISSWLGEGDLFLTLWVYLRWPGILVAVIGGLLALYTAAPNLPISAWRAH